MAAEALDRVLRPGDRLVWGQGAGEPLTLTEAVLGRCSAALPLSVFAGASFSRTLQPGRTEHLRISSFGALGSLRRLWETGAVAVIPCHSGQIHRYITDGDIGCDVALIQVSPPGPDGSQSFGVTNDYMAAAVAKARAVVAEINHQVPWTYARAPFPAERIGATIETDRPLVQVPSSQASPTDLQIAAHCARFIGDGAVLQLGIGAIPDTVLAAVADRRDLGIHAPMISDAVVALIESGVITNARKPSDPGVTVTGLLVGTDRLYRFAHKNPVMAVAGSDYVSDERVLAAIPNFITINSAIEIDLSGQVNAEMVDGKHIGAIGGQSDFVRAGHRSVGGRSIIALPATARGGALSRIVARLGGPVTTPRSEVDVVVTEFGAAELRAQPLEERARRLIRIAHPAFQAELEAQLRG